MARFARCDNMITKLHIFRRLAVPVMTFKQIANAFFPGGVGQDFMSGIAVAAGGDAVAAMKFDDAIFNAQPLDLRGVAFAVVSFNLFWRFMPIFLRFLRENRV